MAKFVIEGRNKLSGVLSVSGSKNAALPILAAALIAKGEYILHNVPDLKDIETMIKLLTEFGLEVEKIGRHSYKIINNGIKNTEAPYELVSIMRASFLVMGPLLASCGEAKVSLPGGCAIGTRPVDLHLKGFEKLGAKIVIDHGFVSAQAGKLQGAEIEFPIISVTGTENVVMAAVLAPGKTVIKNAAREPEVEDLCRFLNKMGAEIEGISTDRLEIHGVDKLVPCEHSVIPDRIEAGTFIILSALFGGDIQIENAVLEHLPAFKAKMEEMGIEFVVKNNFLYLIVPEKLNPIKVFTEPFPGYPTDLQAQAMVLMSLAQGVSKIKETIFENRFMHVLELNRMGAKIAVEGNTAVIGGKVEFTGAEVKATDLRAGACLVLAGLIAKNTTIINEVEHIDRGYEDLVGRLNKIGGRIERVE